MASTTIYLGELARYTLYRNLRYGSIQPQLSAVPNTPLWLRCKVDTGHSDFRYIWYAHRKSHGYRYHIPNDTEHTPLAYWVFLPALLQVVGQWERAAAAVGNAVLIVRLVQGGTLFYMWSECLFGLVEEVGPLAATVAVAVRPVAVYALSSVSTCIRKSGFVPDLFSGLVFGFVLGFGLVWFGPGLCGSVWSGLVWSGLV